MKITSKTGLTASPLNKIDRKIKQKNSVQLRAIAQRAPFILKPYAGLYNPYPYGCSLLCNHPTDNEVKELLQKAKDTWVTEGRNLLLAEEVEAIRQGVQQISTNNNAEQTQKSICIPQVESVPEELFRRYTDTDSRPLTPAPTLVSGATRISGSRRCVTPDPIPTNQIKEKTLLVLDLRRSHSQETLSWYGSSSLHEPPLIRIQRVATRAGSFEDVVAPEGVQQSQKSLSAPIVVVSSKTSKVAVGNKAPQAEETSEDAPKLEKKPSEEDDEDDDEEYTKRRGKKRKKRGRDASRGPPAFQPSLDPETQVATIGTESHNPSARPSLVPDSQAAQEMPEETEKEKGMVCPSATPKHKDSLDIDSYLGKEILRQLRRELNEEIVDSELNHKRRKALEEAFKTISKGKSNCGELIAIQKELKVPPVNADLWISLPRTFSRSSASFELPMDSRALSTMTPMEYIRDLVSISSARKLLYNCLFNKYKMELDDDTDYKRKLSGQNLQACLDLVMGRPMNETQAEDFKNLIEWKEEETYDFKTCCGIFALCERLLAPQFCPQLPDRKADPCHEIETADFEVLSRKLHGIRANDKLVNMLIQIKTL